MWHGASAIDGMSPTFQAETVPTLEEALAVLRPTRLGLLLELKAAALHPGLAADVAQVLGRACDDRALPAAGVTVQSFDHEAVMTHRRLLPGVPVGVLGSPPVRELGAYAAWAAEVNPMHGTVSRQYVEAVHRHGLRCHVWTVNRPARIRRAVELGVDGIITNRPRVLRDMLTSAPLSR